MSAMPTPVGTKATAKPWVMHRAALAGFGFSLSWLIGLLVFAASTTVVATGADVIDAYRGHAVAGALQYLFTEGLPPLAILIIVGGLAQRMAGGGFERLRKVAWRGALAASIISFLQFALGLALVAVAVPMKNAALSAVLSDSVTRADGVKMLLLAVVATSSLIYLLKSRQPRLIWLAVISALLATTIAASGVGYLIAIPSLATAADASLPLLLIWMTGFGVVLGRAGS